MEPETEATRWDEVCRQTIDYLTGWLRNSMGSSPEKVRE